MPAASGAGVGVGAWFARCSDAPTSFTFLVPSSLCFFLQCDILKSEAATGRLLGWCQVAKKSDFIVADPSNARCGSGALLASGQTFRPCPFIALLSLVSPCSLFLLPIGLCCLRLLADTLLALVGCPCGYSVLHCHWQLHCWHHHHLQCQQHPGSGRNMVGGTNTGRGQGTLWMISGVIMLKLAIEWHKACGS